MPLDAGSRLGPYEILAPLGAGGMGEVWKARDARLDRIVALKRLASGHAARLEQEGRAIAALNHPHICQIYDIGPDYIVMEYVQGRPLSGPLAVEEAVRLAVQISSALEEAHGKRILHRDLKPANILVTAKGAVKLLDFGLAKLLADSDTGVTKTIEGSLLGTAAYMAPEQAEGKTLDERSDIFSFGAVLYEMLSGRRAFGGDTMAQVLSAVLRDEPSRLEVPAALERVVTRCLAKQPGERFQTAAELKAALEQVFVKPIDRQPSIAVLPFANMSRDEDNEYFSDGLAEEIINLLAQIPGLKVIARTSAFAFKGKNEDIRKIAETLGVTSVLEGSVRRAGSRLRVTAQLIHASDGTHLWSQRYDRQLADVFDLQDEIAQAIAAALQMKLSAEPARHYTPNLPAYEAYLKGRHHVARFTSEALARSRECFEQAIALDPKFALAHVGLSDCFLDRAVLGVMPAREAMPMVREAARRALEIDPALPEAQAILGVVAGIYEYDWKEAERRFRLAMARDPVPAYVRDLYGLFYLLAIGRPREAVHEVERACKQDPLNVFFRIRLAVCLLAAGSEAEGEAELRQVLEIDENFQPALGNVVISYALRGELAEARACAESAYASTPGVPQVIGLLAGVLALSGDTGRAETFLEKLRPGQAYGAPRGLAIFHVLCGEIEKAADCVAKAIEQRDSLMIIYLRLPIAKDLRSSPRWPKLAKMMNLPDVK
ncbi:MAG TPA: protein kinase [Bryobacteraceae bacterium]|nr:protein kinase [Bryobacteraceae bacterium]